MLGGILDSPRDTHLAVTRADLTVAREARKRGNLNILSAILNLTGRLSLVCG